MEEFHEDVISFARRRFSDEEANNVYVCFIYNDKTDSLNEFVQEHYPHIWFLYQAHKVVHDK